MRCGRKANKHNTFSIKDRRLAAVHASKMRPTFDLILAGLCLGVALGLECRFDVSEERCARLHERYDELNEEYKASASRMHLNPAAYSALHNELARVATLAGKPVPGSTQQEMDDYVAMYSGVDLSDESIFEESYHDNSLAKDPAEANGSQLSDDLKQQAVPSESNEYSDPEESKEMPFVSKQCHPWVPRAKCNDLLKRYFIMKELYGNDTTKDMLDMNAYNDLHRELTEAGLSVVEKNAKQMTCDDSVSKEECEALMNKYKVMKEMYNDPDLKAMLNPDAYSELHREMEAAGITTDGGNKKDVYEDDMNCDSSVTREDCEILLKKYKLMKEMYNDSDLKAMLNPSAYNELHREMEEAGIEVKKSKGEFSCDASLSTDDCKTLMKKYKLMKEMYNDADLKKMLNPDAYNDLHREMEDAGISIDGDKEGKDYSNEKKKCASSVPKEKCDALLKRYEVMKEMYSDDEMRGMLNPDSYNELHREMEAAGIKVEKTPKKDRKTCNSSVSKEECESLLKKYEVMKKMYNDADLKQMLNHDAYSNLHRQLEAAGVQVEPKNKKGSYSEKSCNDSVSKEECEALMKKYTVMKELYGDANFKSMLNPDAYSTLHKELSAAGIVPERSKKDTSVQPAEVSSYPLIRKCSKDGLFRYDQYSFIFCADGFGFVQRCPSGTMNDQTLGEMIGYGKQIICTLKYIDADATEGMDRDGFTEHFR